MPAPHHKVNVPFGIGTMCMLGVAALVASTGAVLAIGTPASQESYAAGRLRDYAAAPHVGWTQSSDTLDGYRGTNPIALADTHDNQWLLSYPSGSGRAFMMVDRLTGAHRWKHPLVAGLGDCAFDADGTVGCAVKIGDRPDGFYLLDSHGAAQSRSALDDTAKVVGAGPDFLRVNQSGYQVTMRTPAGQTLWSRTFAAAATATVDDQLITVATTDGSAFALDPETGADRIACSRCDMTAFPTGIAVEHSDATSSRVDTYARGEDGEPDSRPTHVAADRRLLSGPSTQAVLTGTDDDRITATSGHYEIRDPARAGPLWQTGGGETSKANSRACGTQVAIARKDRSHVAYRIDDGTTVGTLAPPDADSPDSDIDQSSCVGSAGDLLVFANANQLSAFDPAHGSLVWTYPLDGQASDVDGYIVLTQRATLSVLRPS